MGAESIEVVDNGCGIDEKDWKSVGELNSDSGGEKRSAYPR